MVTTAVRRPSAARQRERARYAARPGLQGADPPLAARVPRRDADAEGPGVRGGDDRDGEAGDAQRVLLVVDGHLTGWRQPQLPGIDDRARGEVVQRMAGQVVLPLGR